MSIFSELKRKHIFRVGVAYVSASWLILQVGDLVFPLLELEMVPMKILLIVLVIAFPLVLFFSLTRTLALPAKGVQLDQDAETSRRIAQAIGKKKIDRLIIIVLTLALGFFALDKFVIDPARDASRIEAATKVAVEEALQKPQENSINKKSIAVLPFIDMSPDHDQEYFSDGLTEELLNLLAKIQQLHVVARTSAFYFKGEKVDIRTVAKKLNVANVLEGSVRKSGNTIRITAQLIQAETGYHLWSDTYDRTFDDIFLIQDEIAERVTEALAIEILGEPPKVPETDPEIFALYLQANYMQNQHSADGFKRSIDKYQEVLEMDPSFAPAWDLLCSALISQADYGLEPREVTYNLAREACQNALEIDPDFASAHARLGWIDMKQEGDLAGAAKRLKRALELEPTNIEILSKSAVLAESLGRPEEALELKKNVVERDPVIALGYANLAVAYYKTGQLVEAESNIRTTLALSPNYVGGQYQLGLYLLFQGKHESALTEFEKEKGDEEYFVKGIALASHDLGRDEKFKMSLSELIVRWGDDWPSEIAHVYAYIDDKDKAFEWLEKDFEVSGSAGWGDAKSDLLFNNLRNDTRWDSFMEKVGVSQAQLDLIDFVIPESE